MQHNAEKAHKSKYTPLNIASQNYNPAAVIASKISYSKTKKVEYNLANALAKSHFSDNWNINKSLTQTAVNQTILHTRAEAGIKRQNPIKVLGEAEVIINNNSQKRKEYEKADELAKSSFLDDWNSTKVLSRNQAYNHISKKPKKPRSSKVPLR